MINHLYKDKKNKFYRLISIYYKDLFTLFAYQYLTHSLTIEIKWTNSLHTTIKYFIDFIKLSSLMINSYNKNTKNSKSKS